MERSEERAACNELTFRDANEKIAARARELDVDDAAPYICECEAEGCTHIIRLTRAEYADARVHPTQFVLAPGHTFRNGRIVEEHDGYVVVRKWGIAADLSDTGGRETGTHRAERGASS